MDPDGREIWIGEYKYSPNTECPSELSGDDANAWNSLNSLSNHKLGGKVVSELCKSKKKYSISTGFMEENSNYDANKNPITGKKGGCGGTINIIERVANMDQTLSHELFHAYQDDNGQYGNYVHNEVEAFMFEALVCGDGMGHLRPNDTYPMSDSYVKAVFAFKEWGDNPPSSEKDFNSVFRPIREGFLSKSFANSTNTYTKNECKKIIPKRNLLRELIFTK